MAQKDLKQLLERLDAELGKNSEAYRRLVSDTKAHYLTIEKGTLTKEIKQEMLLRGGFKKLPNSIEKIIEDEVDLIFDYFKKVLHPSNFEGNRRVYYTSDFKATSKKLTVMIGVKDGKGTRKVFQYFRRIKQRAQKRLVQNLNKQIKILNNSRKNKLEEIDPAAFINIGHSEGSAVSSQRKAAVQNALFMFSSKADPSVVPFIRELSHDIGFSVTKKPGKQKDYIDISLESDYLNKKRGREEERKAAGDINKSLQAIVEKLDVPNLKGSMSSRERREAEILNSFADIKGRKIKNSIKKQKIENKKSKATKTRKSKASKAKGFSDNIKAGVVKFTDNENRKQSSITLFALLNQKLPETVIKNMKFPRLENRTGNFAGSVRVTDVSTTRQGYASIGYTYEKNPYQVFESSSGTRFSSAERDPRSLIDKSIREIAAQLVTTRLYTRRL